MTLAEKLKHLRLVEGIQRGFGRALTKAEVARMLALERGRGLTHAYLSQLEAGKRKHLSHDTRELLAAFFRVHPGYLVSDPEGMEQPAPLPLFAAKDSLKDWLLRGAAELEPHDPHLAHTLAKLVGTPEPRRYLLLVNRLIEFPPERLNEVLVALGAPDATA